MHGLFSLLLVLLFGMWQSAAIADDEQDSKLAGLIDGIDAQIANGETNAALVALLNAAQEHPDAPEIRQMLATTSIDLGNGARAEKEIQQAMELGLDPVIGWPTLVKAIFIQGEMDRVIDTAYLMPVDMPLNDRADILGMRGFAEASNRQWSKAKDTLQRALSIAPNSLPAQLGMALLYGRRGQFDETRQWIDRTFETHPEAPDAWGLRGELAMAQGEYAQAEAAFDNAASKRAYPGIEHALRALALSQLKRYPEAAAELAVLVNTNLNDHPYVNYVKGRLHFEQEKYQAAVEAFDAVYSANPRFLPNRLFLAVTRIMLQQPEQALVHAQFFISRTKNLLSPTRIGDGLVTVKRLQVADADASQYKVAEDALVSALTQAPGDAVTLDLLTAITLLQGKDAESTKYAKQLELIDSSSAYAEELTRSLVEQPTDLERNKNDYEEGLLRVLDSFTNNKLQDALAQAQDLSAQSPRKTDPINLIAATHLRLGQWDMAKRRLQESLALDPEQPDVAVNLAKVEMQTNDPAQAKAVLQRLRPDELGSEGTLLLFQLQAQLGELEEGLRLLESSLIDHPEASDIRAVLAAQTLMAGDAGKVEQLTAGLSEAQMEATPEFYELRVRAQLLANDIEGALATAEQWVRSFPDSASAQFYLAEALVKGGESERADAAIDRAVTLDPNFLEARIGQIKSLARQNRLTQADAAIATLRDDFGEPVAVLEIEGWFALGTGDYARARGSLERALASDPNNNELALLLIRTLLVQESYDEAIALMQRRLEQSPQNLKLLMTLAGSYLALQRDADAKAVYARIVDAYPNHIAALNNLAWLSRDDDLEAALGYARTAMELLPTDPYVLATNGKLLLMHGDTSDGIAMLRQAMQRLPANTEMQLDLGRALAEHYQYDEAQALLGQRDQERPRDRSGQRGQTRTSRDRRRQTPAQVVERFD